MINLEPGHSAPPRPRSALGNRRRLAGGKFKLGIMFDKIFIVHIVHKTFTFTPFVNTLVVKF